MRVIGSQRRETLEESGYRLVLTWPDVARGTVILEEIETGKRELWVKHDTHAGYVIEINGKGYEFVRSV